MTPSNLILRSIWTRLALIAFSDVWILPIMPSRAGGPLALVVVVAVLAVSGSILVWSASYHDLGQVLIGAAILAGVVYPAITRSRMRQR